MSARPAPAADNTPLPPGFLLGAATSAFQIEGAAAEDGRGASIWDRFCAEEGRIEGGGDATVSCDHYHRMDGDLDLLASLGVDAYRFSIAWPRLLPEGRGRVEARGVAHYDRLVDALLARNITPIATLYHWDLPVALHDAGGWPARSTAEAFGEYAALCFERFGDRVAWWVSINEPWIAAVLGYELGVHAPGHQDVAESFAAAHHLLLAHGRAAAALDASGQRAQIGVAHSLFPHEPASDDAADVAASHASDGYVNRLYLDPLQRGAYPEDMLALYEAAIGNLDVIRPGDLAAIGARSDFIGVNYYTRRRVAAAPQKRPWPWQVQPPVPGVARTDADWEIVPQSFTDLLLRLAADYPDVPLLVTENGGVFGDGPDAGGTVHDHRRIRFLHDHLAALLAAHAAGAPVAGYCHWSLLDNFEWALGYAPRFGLIHVDYATQERRIKESGRYLAACARGRRLEPVPPEAAS